MLDTIDILANDQWRNMTGYGFRVIGAYEELRKQYKVRFIELVRRKGGVHLQELHNPSISDGFVRQITRVELRNSQLVLAEGLFPAFYASLLKLPRVVYDVHGIAEEASLYKRLVSKTLERVALSKASAFVFVSDAMRSHFERSYSIKHSVVIPSYYSHDTNHDIVRSNLEERRKLKIDDNQVVVIYSGGMQKWQNIEQVIDAMNLIQRRLDKNVRQFILTPEENEAYFKKKVDKHITVKWTHGDELRSLYRIANYGLIPRKASLINKVSCPTKMLDYIAFGIIPIVLDEFGDFFSLGLEYLPLSGREIFLESLTSNKSEINRKVYSDFFSFESNRISFHEFLGILAKS